MHQKSAPTWDFGAPTLPLLPPQPRPSRRGRCVECVLPIYDDEEAVHTQILSSTCRDAVPYAHVECPA